MRRVVPLFELAHDGVKQFTPTTVADLHPATAPVDASAAAPGALVY